jgi:L1 cell adhesion molecule like protein
MTEKIISLGEIELSGIPPAPSGVPEIDLTFHIDANGILNVEAVVTLTGKENKITVTNDNGRLSNEDIERVVKDAEKYRAEDEKQKQTNSAQNTLESYCFNMKSSVEDGKLIDNISESDKITILDKCKEVFRWLDANKLAEKEQFEYQQKELESVYYSIIEIMDNRASDMADGMAAEFPGARGTAPDGGEAPWTDLSQNNVVRQTSMGAHHRVFSDTGCDQTVDIKKGKLSHETHVRYLDLS